MLAVATASFLAKASNASIIANCLSTSVPFSIYQKKVYLNIFASAMQHLLRVQQTLLESQLHCTKLMCTNRWHHYIGNICFNKRMFSVCFLDGRAINLNQNKNIVIKRTKRLYNNNVRLSMKLYAAS